MVGAPRRTRCNLQLGMRAMHPIMVDGSDSLSAAGFLS
jgi:hypothetical protein